MNIAIVEDSETDAKVLKDYIDRYAESHAEVCSVSVYSDGVQFLTNYKPEFDVVFMDIEMPYKDGLKVSAKLRETDPAVCLVFITNMRQYAIKGYEVEAFYFIVKPVTYEVFEFHFRRIAEKVKNNLRAEILIASDGGKQRVYIRDIDYVEVINHKTVFHIGERCIETWSPLYKITEELEQHGFALCNACYLVNLNHVKSVKNDVVCIAGVELKISRPKRKDFMSKLMASMNIGG